MPDEHVGQVKENYQWKVHIQLIVFPTDVKGVCLFGECVGVMVLLLSNGPFIATCFNS